MRIEGRAISGFLSSLSTTLLCATCSRGRLPCPIQNPRRVTKLVISPALTRALPRWAVAPACRRQSSRAGAGSLPSLPGSAALRRPYRRAGQGCATSTALMRAAAGPIFRQRHGPEPRFGPGSSFPSQPTGMPSCRLRGRLDLVNKRLGRIGIKRDAQQPQEKVAVVHRCKRLYSRSQQIGPALQGVVERGDLVGASSYRATGARESA